jgi:hypothetical protein
MKQLFVGVSLFAAIPPVQRPRDGCGLAYFAPQ